jgi:hypothetical protein
MMVVEYMPDFSTVIESGHCWGSVSVGPGSVEAFVVGTGVGSGVGSVVGTSVGAGVITGSGGDEHPAAARSTARVSAREKTIR